MADLNTGIYQIVNTVNGRRYIGSAAAFPKRWRQHRVDLKRNAHHSRFLQRAWNKYGPAAFSFQVVLYCDKPHLLMYEQAAIDALKPDYNSTPVAGSMLGYRHTPETKLKMSASRPRDFSPMTGKQHTAETKQRISASRKGKGGGPRSAERLAKIGAAHKGRTKSPEHRAKISATLTGTSTGRGKLTHDQVRAIRMADKSGLKQVEIARQLGIAAKFVHTVVRGHGYSWVD